MTDNSTSQGRYPGRADSDAVDRLEADHPLRAWQFTHPYMSHPVTIEGRWSGQATKMAFIIHMEREFPVDQVGEPIDWFACADDIEMIEIPLEGF